MSNKFEKNKYCYITHSNLTLLTGEAKSYIVVNSNLMRGFYWNYIQMAKLFSYGTLQLKKVQIETFGKN